MCSGDVETLPKIPEDRHARWAVRVPPSPEFRRKDLNLKAMVHPVVMYGCESWTIKKAECRRFDAFEVWGWRRLLRVP